MSETPHSPIAPATTFSQTTLGQFSHGQSLTETLARMEGEVRKYPDRAENRWALAELLCISGQWKRAAQQAEQSAQIQPKWMGAVHVLHSLIRAEQQREEVFSGLTLPDMATNHPSWMDRLAAALVHHTKGEHAAADDLREQALSAAPGVAGRCVWSARGRPNGANAAPAAEKVTEQSFAWIGDSDTRLGPVCEIIISGAYCWHSFSKIAEIQIAPPRHLIDLIWLPVQIRLSDTDASGAMRHAYLPARSVCADISQNRSGAGNAKRDALLLSRLTEWKEVGKTGIFVSGQKTWMTDGTDWPVLDMREIYLDSAAPGATEAESQ